MEYHSVKYCYCMKLKIIAWEFHAIYLCWSSWFKFYGYKKRSQSILSEFYLFFKQYNFDKTFNFFLIIYFISFYMQSIFIDLIIILKKYSTFTVDLRLWWLCFLNFTSLCIFITVSKIALAEKSFRKWYILNVKSKQKKQKFIQNNRDVCVF